MRNLILIVAVLTLATGLMAGEKKLMHCFFFTAVDSATQADWDAFYKATDALPGRIPGLSKVWYGKLARPMPIMNPDGETRKKLTKSGEKATGEVTRLDRQFGVCMEFADKAALDAYGPHPAHKEWEAVYGKVRMYGTTTVNFMGQ